MLLLFSVLLGFHFLGDFIFQTARFAEKKQDNLLYLFFHSLIHIAIGIILLIILGIRFNALLLMAIFIQHLVIDVIKIKLTNKNIPQYLLFIFAQSAHLVMLLIISFFWYDWIGYFDDDYISVLACISGIIGIVNFSGILMGLFTKELIRNNPELKEHLNNGLVHGGRYIGILERLSIFIFIMINQPLGVGFLIAAKSLLRMEPGKEHHKRMEYILVGTLFSFLLAIIFSIFTRIILNMVAE